MFSLFLTSGETLSYESRRLLPSASELETKSSGVRTKRSRLYGRSLIRFGLAIYAGKDRCKVWTNSTRTKRSCKVSAFRFQPLSFLALPPTTAVDSNRRLILRSPASISETVECLTLLGDHNHSTHIAFVEFVLTWCCFMFTFPVLNSHQSH